MSSNGDSNGNKEESKEARPSTPKDEFTAASDCVVVQDDEGGDPMELLLNQDDASLGVTTLTAAFPGAHGLKYKNPKTGASRALAMDTSGTKFMPPPDGWDGKTFTVIFPPSRGGEAKRRKVDGGDSDDDDYSAKQKRIEDPSKPTDLIVLGVNFNTTPEAFKTYFEQFGKVTVADLKVNYEGKSKGFGFVLMSSKEEQDKVLACDSHNLDGRRIEVKVPDGRSESFRNPLLSREQSTNKVFVGRLPDTTTEELKSFFDTEAKKLNPHANITDCFLPRPFRGFGFVTFSTCEMARKICLANNFVMKGSPLAVSLAVPREPEMGMGRGGGGRGSYGGGGYPGAPYSSGYGSSYGYGGGRDVDRGYDDWHSSRGGYGQYEEVLPPNYTPYRGGGKYGGYKK